MQTKRKRTFSPSFSTRRLFPSVNHLNCMELHQRHNNSSDLSRRLDLKRLQLPATGVKQLQPPHTHTPNLGRQASLLIVPVVLKARSECGGRDPLTTCRSDSLPCHRRLLSTELVWFQQQIEGKKKNVQFHREALSTSAYWLKYILALLSNSQI